MGVSLSTLCICGSRNNPLTDEQPHNDRESIPHTKNNEEPQPMKTRRTASNVLYVALERLGSISNNVPVAGALSGNIEPLLDIASRIEQSSANAQGLIQLATRIERLTPIVEEMAKGDPDRGQAIILDLQTELTSMATDLKAASQRGKLNQFFNSADDASPLSKHNMILAQMIADSTEVLRSLRDLESSKLPPPTVMGDIAGGVGVAGGQGHAGGEGGEGCGPQLEMDPDKHYQFGNVSGGTGGTGGVGVEVGGRGGTGKGPVQEEVTSIM
ncbi:hypothetical protein K438DRAFT_1991213 [Mycena galopus ATCC 62051]|nr:hypothetical protein K438DRAFT_1991213 [Mycena galopus ATCC 62051]